MSAPTSPDDPFRKPRRDKGVLECTFNGERIPMILRHADVRQAAKDWKTFSSDAPFRVPVPSEEAVRTTRQLPIERDPPEHTEYRAIVEPFFQRAKDPAVMAQVQGLIDGMVVAALGRETLEVVDEFALPLQARALTYLLNVPESEADTWIAWGIHVFKVTGGPFKKATVLESYLQAQFDRAEATPGDDFFSALAKATYRGRRLTREEMMGFGNLAFAGGRDTMIHTTSSIFAYFGTHPEGLDYLRENPERIVHATEEFFRVFTPLTQIGRVCTAATDVHGIPVKAGERVSLCWASANFDETVFEAPEELRLDRKPNPHLAFGTGAHLCLGAPHARLVIRNLLNALTDRVAAIEILRAQEHFEEEARYVRKVGYKSLTVKLRLR